MDIGPNFPPVFRASEPEILINSGNTESDSTQDNSRVYSDHEYVPGYIHKRRCTILGTEYLMHWKYFPLCDKDTWEKAETIEQDCPDILREFLNSDRSN